MNKNRNTFATWSKFCALIRLVLYGMLWLSGNGGGGKKSPAFSTLPGKEKLFHKKEKGQSSTNGTRSITYKSCSEGGRKVANARRLPPPEINIPIYRFSFPLTRPM